MRALLIFLLTLPALAVPLTKAYLGSTEIHRAYLGANEINLGVISGAQMIVSFDIDGYETYTHRIELTPADAADKTLGVGINTWTFNGLTYNSLYQVDIFRIDGDDYESSPLTANVYTAPEFSPTSLAAVADGENAIDLTWTKPTPNPVTGYQIEKSLTGSTGWASVASVSAATASYSVTGLPGNTAQYFRIRSWNDNPAPDDDSVAAWSATATATTDADETAPTVANLYPLDNAIDIAANVTPSITFSETVVFGTGSITLRENDGGWADVEAFDVATEVGSGAGQVEVTGSTVTIHPTSDLVAGKVYSIRIASTAIDDIYGNSYSGISNDTTWSFTVESSITVDADIVAQWRLNDGSGTTAVDDNGNAHPLTLYGSPTWGSGALNLDGTTQYAQASAPLGGNDYDSWTHSLWVKITAPIADFTVFFGNGYYGSTGYYTGIASDGKIRYTSGTAAVNTTSGGLVPGDTWTHVVFVKDGDQLHIYVNGSFIQQIPVAASTGTAPKNFTIGGYPDAGAVIPYFAGSVDDVRLYDVAKDSTFISALYTAGRK